MQEDLVGVQEVVPDEARLQASRRRLEAGSDPSSRLFALEVTAPASLRLEELAAALDLLIRDRPAGDLAESVEVDVSRPAFRFEGAGVRQASEGRARQAGVPAAPAVDELDQLGGDVGAAQARREELAELLGRERREGEVETREEALAWVRDRYAADGES